ncbi:hypothetical protein ACFLTR_04705, partial [Chloroflexota bacterium]
MFEWLGRLLEKSKEKTGQLQPMFEWRGQQFRRSKEKTGQLQPRESSDLMVQDKTTQQVSPDLLRSLLKTAIADAEQIAGSIKMRAQTEAEAEAARIIAEARLEVEKIKGKAEINAQKQAEEILSAASRQAEITEVEAKYKALQFLIRAGEEVEKELGEDYKRAYARLSASLQNLINEGQNIAMELKDKTADLWESKRFELKGY